ncbi:hypothetical protein BRADI_1g44422v3 [Brachypodium distachyon]|uniref:Uncharacterized protein n=1 Tax=Brachypodium distachyon TaxID=15368 RepID=A0A2K2DPB5_BRADI|nr:hypothetical protein BRADI_1g44422v3 [Brachypodium distachyon]
MAHGSSKACHCGGASPREGAGGSAKKSGDTSLRPAGSPTSPSRGQKGPKRGRGPRAPREVAGPGRGGKKWVPKGATVPPPEASEATPEPTPKPAAVADTGDLVPVVDSGKIPTDLAVMANVLGTEYSVLAAAPPAVVGLASVAAAAGVGYLNGAHKFSGRVEGRFGNEKLLNN